MITSLCGGTSEQAIHSRSRILPASSKRHVARYENSVHFIDLLLHDLRVVLKLDPEIRAEVPFTAGHLFLKMDELERGLGPRTQASGMALTQ